MKFHATISSHESTPQAISRIVSQLRSHLSGVDVAFCFFTPHHAGNADQIVQALSRELQAKSLVGCSAEGVIAESTEIERSPGICVLAGEMKGVSVHPFHIPTDDWRPLLSNPDDLLQRMGCGSSTRAVIGFGDPWTTALNQFMGVMDQQAPSCPLIGGMASAAHEAGKNVLLFNDDTLIEGFVGVSLAGPVEVQTVVSQGARPIGEPMVITKGRENIIEQLGGKPAMQMLQATFEKLPQRDQMLLQHGLMIGRAISEYRESFGRGDFLVRNISGADEKTGAMALNDLIRIGQTVQFHVRDTETADEDLRLMLAAANKAGPYDGALLFSCNGRGVRMFEEPNHDISVAEESMPGVPVAGFFAMGEIGPVGGRNFIHGHTASLALMKRASVPSPGTPGVMVGE